MTNRSIPSTINIVETVYSAAESTIHEQTTDLEKALVGLSYEQHERIWQACMLLVADVKWDAFRAGWQMRAQV